MRRNPIRSVLGSGRWTRPARWTLLGVIATIAAAAVGGVAAWQWVMRTEEPARTIVTAATLLRGPVRLASPLDAAWDHALEGARSVDGAWQALLAPPLPPAICPNPEPDGALGRAILSVADAVRRSAARDELLRRMTELREVGSFPPASRGEFLLRYNLARAYLAAGDAAAAAEAAEPVFDGYLNGDRLPAANFAAATRLVEQGRVSDGDAVLGFHARFLAGAIAYRRGEVATAIKHFRLSINAVNYLLASGPGEGLNSARHYQRLPIPLNTFSCGGGSDDAITSLDAYAGLVASYLASPDFRDPTRLRPEVERTRLQIDPDDPFRPVLRHAAVAAGRGGGSPIPENVLWAASNLQRVYHYNRLNPDPRLEVTRAVLLLHLTSNAVWVDAMTENGDAEVCGMLRGIGDQLHREASARTVSRSAAGNADSARAAVALHAYARLNGRCAEWDLPRLSADVRSAWIRRGAPVVGGRLPALYEAWRVELEHALDRGGAGVAQLEPVLRRIRAHRAAFGAGRVPADLPAQIDPAAGRRFVDRWWRSLHADMGRALVDAATAERAAISAGRAPQLLATLHAVARHGGLRPDELYAASDLAPLARSGGEAAYAAYRIRYAALGNPIGFAGLLGVGFVLVSLLLTTLYVSVWRYELLTSRRLYAHERESRRGA